MSRRYLLPILTTVALALPSTASAQDFTFHVPVELTGLHRDVTSFHLQCTVQKADRSTVANVVTISMQLDADGSYTGPPITLTADAPNLTDDQKLEASQYECRLSLMSGNQAGGPTETHDLPWLRSRDGTTLVAVVTGPIVQGG